MLPNPRSFRFGLCYFLIGISLSALAQGPLDPLSRSPASTSGVCLPFAPSNVYLANMNAESPTLGDFNGDGVPDIASVTLQWVGHWEASLTILLGEKNGTFQQGQSWDIGMAPVSNLAVGDFNQDGKLDVVIADSNAEVLNVFLGNGDGTFQSPLLSPTQVTGFIAVGDFNGDGKLDLALVTQGYSELQVMFGGGDGTFQPADSYPVSQSPTSIAVADFNRDGRLDLAVNDFNGNSVSVLLGAGNGTFGAKTDYAVGLRPFSVLAADLNGDGAIDLATADYAAGTATVLLNQGNGTFRNSGSYPVAHPFAPNKIAAAPLQNGSKPSLFVGTIAGTFVLINKGNGIFRPAIGYEPNSSDVVAADFNSDGKVDLMVEGSYFEEGPGGFTVLFGRGNGVFTDTAAYVAVPDLSGVGAGDFDGDGVPDLALASDEGQIATMLGLGEGRFSAPTNYNNVGGYAGAIAVADFNGDKKLDLAVVLFTTNNVAVLLGNGNGTFTMKGSYSAASSPQFIGLADFNEDGIVDMAITGQGGTVAILLGNGDGSFTKAGSYAVAPNTYGIAVADFNNDGNLDFAVASYHNNGVYIYLGDGKGSFKQGGSFFASAPIDVAAGDFNGDGNWDLASVVDGTGVSILLGDGKGNFQLGATYSIPNAYRVSAADLDGDGVTDLEVVSHEYAMVYFLRSKGDGTFSQPVGSNIGLYSDSLAMSDLNGDGALDLVVPNYEGGDVTVLLNDCAR